ncbi:MAG: hypothetical protein M1288_05055 [Actinobacteria bacterium]|jgi:hypothetical protein|nr:hypothetical protein [Actinomycetota bacterium]
MGALLLALAVAGIIYPMQWQHHQTTVGNQITKKDLAKGTAVSSKSGTCTPRSGPGVLSIPAIGLVAPVESGTSNSVLSVALGHDSSTSWPSSGKSSLIAGHDVGFLSQDTKLVAGNAIDYIEPCAIVHFVVESHIISKPFQSVPMPPKGGLILDSCWPTDALWYTPQRYLVIARYVSTSISSAKTPGIPKPPSVPIVKLPRDILASQLSLATNPWPMGHLRLSGTPSISWTQSQAALQAETSALELLFALRHSIASANPALSSAVAPGVPIPGWLNGTPGSQLNVSEEVNGSTLIGVTLSSSIDSNGNITRFSLVAAVKNSNLIVKSIQRLG